MLSATILLIVLLCLLRNGAGAGPLDEHADSHPERTPSPGRRTVEYQLPHRA